MNQGMTKQKIIGLIGVLHCVFITQLEAHSTHSISYGEAVRLSLIHHPRTHASAAEIELARASILETKGTGFPKLNLEMNGARSDNPLNVFSYKLSQGNVTFNDFGLSQFTGPHSINTAPGALNSPGYYSNLNTGLKIIVPIYSGGETLAKLKRARALFHAAQHGDQSARMLLAYDILQAYEGVLATKKLMKIAQEEVYAARVYVSMTQSLLKQSVVIESDLLLADTYLRTTKASYLSAQIEWKNQLDIFRNLIGKPNSQIIPGKEVRLFSQKRSISKLIQMALHHNADLRALKSAIEASRAQVDTVSSSNKPRINLQLLQNWNGSTIGSGFPSNLIALGMNWELFSFGERTGAIQKAIAEVKKTSYQMDNAINTLRLSIIQAKRAELLAEIQYKANFDNSRQAKEVVNRLAHRYGRGLVPLGQLIESQIKWTDAKNRCVQSQYNKVLAQGRLLMLTNELISFSEQ